MSSDIKLSDNSGCFVCGKNNPIGLKLDFAVEGDEYVTYFTPQVEHQGWVGITHGGIVSTVLDEVMAGYVYILGHHAVTAEITVRLKRPTRTGHKIRFAGRMESVNGRVIHCTATAVDEDGTLVADATGVMVKVGTHAAREGQSHSDFQVA
ncbi:MAG: PaaI family thioesterase [Armatimonadota bacterium]|nr:PaaI family thioesterase [bacterium]